MLAKQYAGFLIRTTQLSSLQKLIWTQKSGSNSINLIEERRIPLEQATKSEVVMCVYYHTEEHNENRTKPRIL